MPSSQYKISEALLKANYLRSKKKQEHELKIGQAFEMPRPPKLLKRQNKVEEYILDSQNIYIIHPEKLRSTKVIFYLHGGAYYTRITLPHWIFIRKLSNKYGMQVIIPDYPTAPAYNYLQTNDFAIKAYKNLLERYSSKEIFFFGDSAGGGLALTLSQSIKKEKLPLPAALVLLSPWLDVSMTNPGIKEIEGKDFMLSLDNLLIAGELYAEDADLKNPLISPIYGDLEGLPPIILFIGTHDILLPDCQKFRDLAFKKDIQLDYCEYDEMLHCWMLFPVPEANEVLEKVQQFISV